MRSKNAIRNLILLLVYELLVFASGIIFPHFIIVVYNSQINGLTSTIARLLSLISLIQSGAVGAAIYQMYEPVAKNDYEKQSAIMYSSRRFYNRFSLIFLLIGIGAGVFYSFYLRNETLSFLEIFLAFSILAVNGANTLLFNSICDIFFSSHQKRYLLSLASICDLIVRYGLMCFVLFFKLHFIFIYVCYLLGGLASVIINVIFYRKLSKSIINPKPEDTNYKIPNRNYLMLSCIGSEVVTTAPTLIITTFIDLVQSSVFSIYSMIFMSMKTILNSVQLSFSAIFGNLVKTADDEKIHSVYSVIELLTICLGTVCGACVGFLLMPFITLYSAAFKDANYVYPILAVFVLAYTVLFAFRMSFGYVATVYGLFKDTCTIILIFAGLGIGISIACTILFGMPYVMIGLIFNQLGCSIATLVVMKKKIPWFKVTKLLIRTAVMVLISAIGIILFFLLKPEISSWWEWLLFAVCAGLSSLVLFLIYCMLFERRCFKMAINYIGNLFRKKKEITE